MRRTKIEMTELATEVLSHIPYITCGITSEMLTRMVFGKHYYPTDRFTIKQAIRKIRTQLGITICVGGVYGGTADYWVAKSSHKKADEIVGAYLKGKETNGE